MLPADRCYRNVLTKINMNLIAKLEYAKYRLVQSDNRHMLFSQYVQLNHTEILSWPCSVVLHLQIYKPICMLAHTNRFGIKLKLPFYFPKFTNRSHFNWHLCNFVSDLLIDAAPLRVLCYTRHMAYGYWVCVSMVHYREGTCVGWVYMILMQNGKCAFLKRCALCTVWNLFMIKIPRSPPFNGSTKSINNFCCLLSLYTVRVKFATGINGNRARTHKNEGTKIEKKKKQILFFYCLSVGRLLSINNMIGLGSLEKSDIQLWLQNSIYFVFDGMDVYIWMQYMELIDNQKTLFSVSSLYGWNDVGKEIDIHWKGYLLYSFC